MKKEANRAFYLVVGFCVLLFAGMIYAWSVLSKPIADMYPEWTKAQLSLTFTIEMCGFCIGGFIGGLLQKKTSTKILLFVSSVMFLVGFIVSAKATSLAALYIGMGVLIGLATGVTYNVVVSAVTLWFPDIKGLVSGVLLVGFGLASFIMGKVYTALTPGNGSDIWRRNFLILGVLMFVVMIITALLIKKPSANFKAPAKKGKEKVVQCFEDIPTREALKRPSAWFFMLWACCFSGAGLAIVSQGTPMVFETDPNVSMDTVATLVGLILVANAVGRIIFGALFDKIGCKPALIVGDGVFLVGVAIMIAAITSHNVGLLTLSYIVFGVGYGCVAPAIPTFASSFYGMTNYSLTFPVVNLNLLVASAFSTVAGSVYDNTGKCLSVALLAVVLLVFSTIFGILIKAPKKIA